MLTTGAMIDFVHQWGRYFGVRGQRGSKKRMISSLLLESEAALCFCLTMALFNLAKQQMTPLGLHAGGQPEFLFVSSVTWTWNTLIIIIVVCIFSSRVMNQLFTLVWKLSSSVVSSWNHMAWKVYMARIPTSTLPLTSAPWWYGGGEGTQAWDPDRPLSQPWIHTLLSPGCCVSYWTFLRIDYYIYKMVIVAPTWQG